MHKEIGGYFELELNRGNELYNGAIKLNSGRNCFKYLLRAKKPKRIYVPYYNDKSMRETSLMEMGIEFIYYNVNKELEIDANINLKEDERILYVNYYSLKDKYVDFLSKQYGDKLIIDNTQAFFSPPLPGIDTFYSLGSKFFGVPSGGYLFTGSILNERLKEDYTYEGIRHLVGRIDLNASEFYEDFQLSKLKRNNQEIRTMSKLSQAILNSIDYEKSRLLRERNFYYLHSQLKDLNELFFTSKLNGPMNYPLLIRSEKLRKSLIDEKIYVPTYWSEILDLPGASNWEKYLSKYLLPLPIDQRYDLNDMEKIVEIIKKG